MEWGDISDKGRAWMRDLGNFGPTVNTRDRMVKGCMLDDDGEAARTYLDSADLRGLAAACNEVADWLDARADDFDDKVAYAALAAECEAGARGRTD